MVPRRRGIGVVFLPFHSANPAVGAANRGGMSTNPGLHGRPQRRFLPPQSFLLSVPEPLLRLADVAEWRRWLAAHHRTSTAAVLMISKKAVPRGVHYEEALEEALCFGWIDGRLHAHDPEHFAVRFSPRRPDSIWSESNRDRVTRLLEQGRMNPAGLAAVEAGKRSGAWQSAYRVSREPAMPRDLREALRADPEAWSHFRAWGTTYRSACIRWVTSAKQETTRKRHIARVVVRARQDRRPGIEGF